MIENGVVCNAFGTGGPADEQKKSGFKVGLASKSVCPELFSKSVHRIFPKLGIKLQDNLSETWHEVTRQ